MNSQAVKLDINSNPIAEQKKDTQTNNQLTLFKYMQEVNNYKLLNN